MAKRKLFGVIGEFESPSQLMDAARKVKEAGYEKFDVYTPYPIHGMDDAMGLKPSPLGWIVFVGGFIGLLSGLLLQTWVSVSAYPLIISGKPLFSFQAFVPVTFELMILFSAFATVFGMFKLCCLPQHHYSLSKSQRFCTATSHGFFLGIESEDNQFDVTKTSALLTKIGGKGIEVIDV